MGGLFLKYGAALIASIATLIGLGISLGICRPAYQTQTVADAEKAQGEIATRIGKAEDRIVKSEERITAEEKARLELSAAILEKLGEVSKQILQVKIDMISEIRGVGSAPWGPTPKRDNRRDH